MRRAALAALALLFAGCGARTGLAGTPTGHAGDGGGAGDGGSGSCQDEIVAAEPNGATALALDGDTAFWGTPDGFVRTRAPGGATTTLASESDSIASIAVDATYVYYAITGRIRRVPRAGGGATDLGTNVGQPFALRLSSSPTLGNAVYYLDYGAGILAGSANALSASGSVMLVDGLDTPGGLAADDEYVYVSSAFAGLDGLQYDGPLFRIDKNGLGRSLLASSLHEPSSVTVYGGRVYYVEQTDAASTLHGGVRSIASAGGTPKNEMTTDGYLPLDVAADASGVYATAYSQTKSVLDRASSSAAPVEIASTPGVFYGAVRTSATAIYWTIQWQGAPPPDGAGVRKVCK